ncbi:hypothetical protein QBR50_13695 [Acinetobacter baumannii]|uniref:hypothetical protein n=2 Tax=Acinetobacter baumannii TaxID=470 RepID=UPI001AED387F|nr:hypothetical protein [Acinetobacter baumannii]MBP3071853.1 hypothetical protein [Acinetobacter baumannii]MDF9437048.1 hypothetical protein [Acinetobacter baumannii]MDG6216499.1 hypothetical protein [Acinetobacter baumannii]MDK3064563.1 hypothetical protein [Acinetobacter baumannii]HAV3501998.1 hypothetical protein [Acinetobacter baumannii]
MTQLFFQAKNFVSKRSLPKLSNVDDLLPNLEYEAYGHWVFENSSASLVDKVNNRLLALQSGATVQPTYTESGVTISTAVGNALVSDLSDTSAQSVTLAAVVKCNNTQLAILLGNLEPNSSKTSSGLSAFVSANKAYLTLKPTAAGSGGIGSLTPASGRNQTTNFFIAVSVNKATKKGIIYVQQNSAELTNEAVYTAAVYESALNNFAVGNNAYTGSNAPANKATFAEAVIFNKALTLDEIKAVATRSKDRMKNRGISF